MTALAELIEDENPAEQRQLKRAAAFGLGISIARNRPRPEPVQRPHMENEPRLPALGTITRGTRQQARRVARSFVRCSRCGAQIKGDAIFDDGRDAHKVCSEARNTALIEAIMQLKAQDGKPLTAEEAEPLVQKEIAGSK